MNHPGRYGDRPGRPPVSTPGRPTLNASRSVDEPTGNAVKTASNPVAKAKTNKKPWVDKELGSQRPSWAAPIETHLHYVLMGRCLPPLFSAALGSEWVQVAGPDHGWW